MFEEVVQLLVGDWSNDLFDPRKRVYWGYLLSALVIGIAWFHVVGGKGLKQSVSAFFVRPAWWSKSARADYLLMMVNGPVMALISPALLTRASVAYLSFTLLHEAFNTRPSVTAELSPGAVALLFTLTLFLVDDFARYWVHRLLHRVAWLWAFHKVHHSATALNPFTVFRTHPVEGVIFSIRSALVHGTCIASFFFLFGDQVTLTTVMGASVFTFLFNVMGANLRHSPVPLRFGRAVERVIMSPAQHQIHHSVAVEHIDRNFGVALSLWDNLFGTICYSAANQRLTFGLDSSGECVRHSLIHLYLSPFKDAGRKLVPGALKDNLGPSSLKDY